MKVAERNSRHLLQRKPGDTSTFQLLDMLTGVVTSVQECKDCQRGDLATSWVSSRASQCHCPMAEPTAAKHTLTADLLPAPVGPRLPSREDKG
ncbi:hypothetical protein MHYP_G00304530 [Metynnis hypsauchen]